ncbi:MAG: sugar ABC transporter permease [Chloroflexi bacterium]|nr:sugar ABC transporter permease [Chloroflexota bacterium]
MSSASAELSVLSAARGARGVSATRKREALYGFLFASPFLLSLILWSGGPIIASAALSLFDYDIVSPPRWAGLNNYVQALAKDDLFWPSLQRTFYYVLLLVPAGIVGSLLLAWILNREIAGFKLFRALFYIPSLTPGVALAVLWRWILNPKLGPVNFALKKWFGITGPMWMGEPSWAIPSLVIMSLWGGLGGNRMLIFLAGLQGVPRELYEAASIDGAGSWRQFIHVTLPIISPTIFLNLVLSIIGALKAFDTAYVATRGGPAYATWFIALHIYQNAFKYYQMGYASALSWIFLAIILAFTMLQFWLQRHWVYYAGEGRGS